MHNPTLRVLQVLELLCSQPVPLRLSQISAALQVPKSTLLPILQTMQQKKFIARDDSDRYSPGIALLGAGAAAGEIYTREASIRSHLAELVERFQETCYYAVLEGGEVLYVDKVDSPQPLRMLTTIGHRLPAYATGIGKALLMDHSLAQLQALYPQGLKPITEHTLQDVEALHSQLLQARELGWTWEVEESTRHIRCFAVPVRTQGRITGAVSIAIPVFRYQEADRDRITEALQQGAASLGSILQCF